MLDNEPILISASYDRSVRVWQPYSGKCCKSFKYIHTMPDKTKKAPTVKQVKSQVNALDISKDRKYLAVSGYQRFDLYHLDDQMKQIMFMDNRNRQLEDNIVKIGFQEDCKWLFTAGGTYVRIWDLCMAYPMCTRIFDCKSTVNSVTLHPNQKELAIATENGTVILWDVFSDQHVQLVPEMDTSTQDVAISPDGQLLAAVNNTGNCFIWNLKSGKKNQMSQPEPRQKLSGHQRYALRCRFSPDGKSLVTTSADAKSRIYKLVNFTWTFHRELFVKGSLSWIWDASFSLDSNYLFTASSDGTVRLWEVETSTVVRKYFHKKGVTALVFRDVPIV